MLLCNFFNSCKFYYSFPLTNKTQYHLLVEILSRWMCIITIYNFQFCPFIICNKCYFFFFFLFSFNDSPPDHSQRSIDDCCYRWCSSKKNGGAIVNAFHCSFPSIYFCKNEKRNFITNGFYFMFMLLLHFYDLL